jgi:hypothetical protein
VTTEDSGLLGEYGANRLAVDIFATGQFPDVWKVPAIR